MKCLWPEEERGFMKPSAAISEEGMNDGSTMPLR